MRPVGGGWGGGGEWGSSKTYAVQLIAATREVPESKGFAHGVSRLCEVISTTVSVFYEVISPRRCRFRPECFGAVTFESARSLRVGLLWSIRLPGVRRRVRSRRTRPRARSLRARCRVRRRGVGVPRGARSPRVPPGVRARRVRRRRVLRSSAKSRCRCSCGVAWTVAESPAASAMAASRSATRRTESQGSSGERSSEPLCARSATTRRSPATFVVD